MSILAARPFVFGGEFDSPESMGPEDGVDWGTATPRNTISLIQLDQKLVAETDVATSKQQHAYKLPRQQQALLLHGIRERFTLEDNHLVPNTRAPDELIVKVQAIGLNPVDWKSVDYGFGIPELPYVSGRDFAGVVVKAPSTASHLKVGDVVLCGSTDYRDLRKAAFQQYAVATTSTVCRVPSHISTPQAAALGVAFVAASLALGVCLGLRLPKGPDLRQIVRRKSLDDLPADAIPECMAIEEYERPEIGDWLVIWGGSSTSALFLSQIALLAGLKVILVVDLAKHGSRIAVKNECVIVDSHSSERAAEIIRGITGNNLRFGIDTVGKDTTAQLAKCLQRNSKKRSHIVGLAALPKDREDSSVVYHSVPVKLFHEVSEVGSSLMTWLEEALQSATLELPRVTEAPGGLHGINDALDMMRQGLISGQRLVVPLQ